MNGSFPSAKSVPEIMKEYIYDRSARMQKKSGSYGAARLYGAAPPAKMIK